jgi:hypothetical protein
MDMQTSDVEVAARRSQVVVTEKTMAVEVVEGGKSSDNGWAKSKIRLPDQGSSCQLQGWLSDKLRRTHNPCGSRPVLECNRPLSFEPDAPLQSFKDTQNTRQDLTSGGRE